MLVVVSPSGWISFIPLTSFIWFCKDLDPYIRNPETRKPWSHYSFQTTHPSPTHFGSYHKVMPLQDVIITTYETLMSTEERMGHWMLLADGVPVFYLYKSHAQICFQNSQASFSGLIQLGRLLFFHGFIWPFCARVWYLEIDADFMLSYLFGSGVQITFVGLRIPPQAVLITLLHHLCCPRCLAVTILWCMSRPFPLRCTSDIIWWHPNLRSYTLKTRETNRYQRNW